VTAVLNPATEETIAEIPGAGVDETDAGVDETETTEVAEEAKSGC